MISEIDLRDWKSEYTQCKTPVKLYEVPRETVVTLCSMDSSSVPIYFSHLDGAYSMCTLLGTNQICHISASADVYQWIKK